MLFDENKATLDIIARLRSRVGGIEVSEFPANPEQAFRTLIHPVGEVCARYYDSAYTDPVINETGVIVQSRQVRYQLHIRARSWAQDEKRQSAVEIMKAVRAALVGWTLPDVADATKLSISQDGFLDESNGIYTAHVVVKCTVPFEEGA